MKTDVVIGGGIAGMIAADRLVANGSQHVILLENANDLGGLLRGFSYTNEGLYFDIGTHIYQETGNSDIDDFVQTSIPSQDLICFKKGKGDIAGCCFDGRLQTEGPFPNIGNLKNYTRLKSSLESHIQCSSEINTVMPEGSLIEESCKRFGELYASEVLQPVLGRIFNRPVNELAAFSMLLTSTLRVNAFDQNQWLDHCNSDAFRAVIAVPHQNDLPEQFQHSRKSFYSRVKGSRHFISGMAKSLQKRGAIVQTDSKISRLNFEDRTLKYTNSLQDSQTIDIRRLVIATGAISAGRLLNLDMPSFEFEKPLKHSIVNFVAARPLETELFYLYGLDPDCVFFRITNYGAFSGIPNDCRVTVEILGDLPGNEHQLQKILLDNLKEKNIIHESKCSFFRLEKLKNGFPMPSIRNLQTLNHLGNCVKERLPDWAVLAGIGAEKCLFFQNEILKHVHSKVRNLCE